jgi:transposase-like protein
VARRSSRELAAIVGGRRWTAEQAGSVLDAASRSGLSLGAFAARHELDPQRLYRWRRQLVEAARSQDAVSFEEIRVAPAAGSGPDEDDRMEVTLPSGHLVRVGASFDEAALRRLLTVLDEMARGC